MVTHALHAVLATTKIITTTEIMNCKQ